MSHEILQRLAKQIRYNILLSTSRAGSGHPTSSLSATELMTGLLFGGVMRYNPKDPMHPNNDRLIFSKGHASPLLYSLWVAAGALDAEELKGYRSFDSDLQGHPSVELPYVEAATGSLGQGLSIGVGLALNAKRIDRLPYRTYVLIGDSEMAEGSQWESIQLAAHYGLHNLIGVLDVNRLGQRGPTMFGHDLEAYRERVSAFGWEAIPVADGHSFDEVLGAYQQALDADRPAMIIAKTIKGKGVSFVEDQNGWHGKALDDEDLKRALDELGEVDHDVRGEIAPPEDLKPEPRPVDQAPAPDYSQDEPLATRDGYGRALVRIVDAFPDLVSLDAEVSNSTRAAALAEARPERFFEMFIAEQNMVGAALGLATRGRIPFVSSFAAFLTRAFDQIRMSQYSNANIKFVGSHAGVSIGMDGPSQMGLEDLAMFRTIQNAVVLYPSDAVSTDKLVEALASHQGLGYLRTTRMKTPIIYEPEETFQIGGSKELRASAGDQVTVVAAGVTVHEALEAHDQLADQGVAVRVLDLYSIAPVDSQALLRAARETAAIITVEDHVPEGGIADAVRTATATSSTPVVSLAVRRKPRSGKPQELIDFEGISADAIVRRVKEIAT